MFLFVMYPRKANSASEIKILTKDRSTGKTAYLSIFEHELQKWWYRYASHWEKIWKAVRPIKKRNL